MVFDFFLNVEKFFDKKSRQAGIEHESFLKKRWMPHLIPTAVIIARDC
jgi:hypothetical protein